MNTTLLDSLFDNLMRLYMKLLLASQRTQVVDNMSVTLPNNASISNTLNGPIEEQVNNTSNLQDACVHQVPNTSCIQNKSLSKDSNSSKCESTNQHACNLDEGTTKISAKKTNEDDLKFILVDATAIVENNYSKMKRKRGRPRKKILD